jgi:hypothetical protein
MSLASALFVFGLMLDILGAFYLAQSFISKNLEDLTFEGTSGYGSPPNLRYIRSNLYQKAEAQVGFCLLTIGFVLQSLDYFFLGNDNPTSIRSHCVLASVLALGVGMFLIAKFVRNRLFTSYARKMAIIVIRERKPEGERNDSWILTVALYLLPQIKRYTNESDHSFANRVLSTIVFQYK